MLRGHVLAILLLAGASASAAQQPNSRPAAATSAQTPSRARSTSAPAPSQTSCQPPVNSPQAPDAWHCVTVKFDYDFNKTPPCSAARPVHPCVGQFAIYETTATTNRASKNNQPIFLFNAPLPRKRKGIVTGITRQSPAPIDLVLGWHKLCVAAVDPSGRESTLRWCQSCGTWICVQVGPTTTPSVPAPGTSTMPSATPPCPSTPPAP